MRATLALGAVLAALPVGSPPRLLAQGVNLEVGRLLEADGWTTYRLGLERGLAGPASLAFHGIHLRDESPAARRHWGAGADLVVLRGNRSGPYLIGGYAAGFSSDSADQWWRSWSAGGGVQLALGGVMALSGELRYRDVQPGNRDGVELAVRLGGLFGGGKRDARGRAPERPAGDLPAGPEGNALLAEPNSAAPGPAVDRPPSRPPLATLGAVGEAPAAARLALADSVVATALEALGTSYRLGGTTSDGFDCSGLIQHAYGRHGIRLPRVSRDQARQGTGVKKDLDALRPGDILTFARSGSRVTHVGLYLGDGRFVHSARRGVQVSALSKSDPNGRWYWKRWMGARRILPVGE